MRSSLVASLAVAAILASTSATLAVPARGIALGEAAKSVELSAQAHYRRCACHVSHRPTLVRRHYVRRHYVRPVVVVEEPAFVVRRHVFVDRPFFFRRAHFVHRPFFHRAHFAHRPFFDRGHFGHGPRFGAMRFAGHGGHFGGHGRFARW
jgi:hypothetical protein